MNKLIFKIIPLVILLLINASCDDKLSVDPVDRIVPTTVQDYHDVLVGGLPAMYHAFTELMTDNVEAREYPSYNNPQTWQEWSRSYLWIDQTPNDNETSPEYAWRWYYADIYKLNLVINNVMEAQGDKDFAAHVKGEALITRAYSYFMLVNMFAKHYNPETAADDLGIPLTTEALEAGFHNFSRSTVQQAYDLIDNDMQEGLSLINDDYLKQPKYHFNSLAALGLASRIALYKGEYDKAKAYATQVLNQNASYIDHNDFPIPSQGQTFNPVEHANNYFTNEKANILMIRAGFFAVNYYKSGFYANSFMSEYDYRDLRKEHNFSLNSLSTPGWYTLKLSLSYEQHNYPLIRTEEVLLNRAEASAKLGGANNLASAVSDLNTLRMKRFQPASFRPYKLADFDTKQEVIDAVLHERRLELCFEGHYWFDLKRNGAPKIIHRFSGVEYVLEENDPRYVLQIPDYELDNNEEMVKNPR